MKYPVYLIHGALGSGKTTIISHLAKVDPFKRAIVIENEFASENVDSATLSGGASEIQVYDINGGCICCSSGEDLVNILERISKSGAKDVPVVIETTGVASSLQLIKKLFLNDQFHQHFKLAQNILLLDALEISPDQLEQKSLDIKMADLILLTKTDLAETEKVEGILAELTAKKAADHIVLCKKGDCDLSRVFSARESSVEALLIESISDLSELTDIDHSLDMLYRVVDLTGSIEKEQLVSALESAKEEGQEIQRVKGSFSDPSGQGWVFEATSSHHEFTPIERIPSQKLVVIGKHLKTQPIIL